MGNIVDRTGVKRIMNNGLLVEVIAYRKSDDIDIMFEDGTVLYHQDYKRFTRGIIKHPNDTRADCKSYRIGESRIMKNGMRAKIVSYKNSKEMSVEFEDGTIVDTNYWSFSTGSISNPIYNQYSKLGEERVMRNGQLAVVIEYRKECDIDIMFEDGTIVEHVVYGNFKKGLISNPSVIHDGRKEGGLFDKKDFTGVTKSMNNGQKATIIRYNGFNDIDIQFEDGTIVEHKQMSAFRTGSIGNPNIHRSRGEIEIIDFLVANNIQFEQEYSFSDLKGVNKGKLRFDFAIFDRTGNVVLLIEFQGKQHYEVVDFFNGDIGLQERLANDELKKKYCISHCIDLLEVKYDSKDIGSQIEKALIGKDLAELSYRHEENKKQIMWHDKTGAINAMSNGQKAKIIAYRGSLDIDVEFEDGTIVCGKAYRDFMAGYIRNPNHLPVNPMAKQLRRNRTERYGETRTMNNGQTATIITYRSSLDIDVQFEDGYIAYSKTYNSFLRGTIRNHNVINHNYKKQHR